MTAGTCSATVTVVGIGTFTCVLRADHEIHMAQLTTDSESKWASVSWTGDNATIRPPGSRRGRS